MRSDCHSNAEERERESGGGEEGTSLAKRARSRLLVKKMGTDNALRTSSTSRINAALKPRTFQGKSREGKKN